MNNQNPYNLEKSEEKSPYISEDDTSILGRIGYGLACSLVGAAVWMAIVFWTSMNEAGQLFGIIVGASFLGGLLFGKRFFNFVKDLFQHIW